MPEVTEPDALENHVREELWKVTPVFSSEFVTADNYDKYEHPLVLLPPQERSLSRPNSPPTALDLLSREGGERPRNVGISSSTERSSLMPRFDPFPIRSNFNLNHLRPIKKASRRKRRTRPPNKDEDAGAQSNTVAVQSRETNTLRKESTATPESVAEVKLYVDTSLLRKNILNLAFPINGNFGVTKITLYVRNFVQLINLHRLILTS